MAMSDDVPQSPVEPWQSLSSLADGQADANAQSSCLEQWASRADVRARWHEYQVIGDVMRSDELATGAASDAAFLQALRQRIDREPPRLMPAVPAPTRRPAWLAPAAMAAGVGAVALTVTTLWPVAGPAPQSAVTLAAQRAPASAVVAVSTTPQVHAVSGQLIRDARLDRYLAAHRQGGSGSALQMPGAVVRSVDTIVLDDK
jgi:sigma-E factor negative regulatory protein RseA